MMLNRLTTALAAAPFFLLAACGNSQDAGAADKPAAGSGTKNGGATQAAAPGTVAKSEILATDKVLGSPDAPVTIIEYASVTCGGCAAAHATILPAIKSEFVDTGKVKIVFREYPKAPASLVNQSFLGSVLARCAAEKGGDEAYFLVIDSLLRTQRAWIGGDTEGELKKIAAQAGMNSEDFDACVTTRQDLLDVINGNIEIAENTHKITGTPSFILNGEKMTVASIDDIRIQINKALGIETPVEAPAEPPTAPAAEDAEAAPGEAEAEAEAATPEKE